MLGLLAGKISVGDWALQRCHEPRRQESAQFWQGLLPHPAEVWRGTCNQEDLLLANSRISVWNLLQRKVGSYSEVLAWDASPNDVPHC